MSFSLLPIIKGCSTGASLIMPIGAQNAFVLKQGISRNYLFMTAFACAIIDASLIILGVGGIGTLLSQNQILMEVATLGGSLFLFTYGALSFKSAFTKKKLLTNDLSASPPKFTQTLLIIAAISLLNPHVYLDTVVLIGTISLSYDDLDRWLFALGAIAASFIWFFTLSFGASYLNPLFEKQIAWRILDFFIAVIMWAIAFSLVVPMIS